MDPLQKFLKNAYVLELEGLIELLYMEDLARQNGCFQIAYKMHTLALQQIELAKGWYKEYKQDDDLFHCMHLKAKKINQDWLSFYETFLQQEDCLDASFQNRIKAYITHKQQHEQIFIQFLHDFKQDCDQQEILCVNCGYVYKGNEMLNHCPCCLKHEGYLEKRNIAS